MLKEEEIGKPDEGKTHVRFDEKGLGAQPFTLQSISFLSDGMKWLQQQRG